MEDYDPAIGNSHDNIADVLLEKGEFDKAMRHYQVAIINMFSDFRDTNIYANPDLEKHHLVGSLEELLIFLSDKANAFLKYYSSDKRVENAGSSLWNYFNNVMR